MPEISAVILTFNEERNIARCLESLEGIADEIVVVDSFSTDRTEEIARQFGVRFIQHRFLGYIEQKNFAAAQAAFDHVLALDADEALSPGLREALLAVKDDLEADGYTMNRLTNYCGQWIRHSGWYPDTKLRLFDRRKGMWKGTNPHDKFVLNPGGTSKHLSGDLYHYSYYTVEEHRQQIQRFSDIASRAKFEKGVRSSWLKIVFKTLARFVKSYIIKLGFLDGYNGWIISTYSAYATFLKYKKLLRIQKSA